MHPTHIIHFIVAHSQPLFCKGVTRYFKRAKGVSLAKTVSIASLLPETLSKVTCNVLVIDDLLENYPVTERIKKTRADFPELKIMALTANTDALYIQKLEKAGADGFVHKSTEGYEIKTGLLKMMQGIKYKCPVIAAAMINSLCNHPDGNAYRDPCLCRRQKEALSCMLKRMTEKEMVEHLGVGLETIKQYRSEVKKKINEAGYDDIFDYARKTGMIQ